jgi:hypothetical protein
LANSILTIQNFQKKTLQELQGFANHLGQTLTQFQTDTRGVLQQTADEINRAVDQSIQGMTSQRTAFEASAEQAAATFRGIREELQIALHERAEIERDFWSEYSNRFEKIRILLPESSLQILGNQLNGDIDVLKDDDSDPTEVCIFDFGDWIVVEFFRGKGSETRLLANNNKNQQILFNQSQLSVKCIRCLGGEKHDHEYLWQVFSYYWLQNKGIIPNLNSNTPTQPTTENLRKRSYRLERWRRDIETLEWEAQEYCKRSGCCV